MSRIQPKSRETFYERAIAKWEENVEEKLVTNRNRPCSLNTDQDNSETASNGSSPLKVYSRERIRSKAENRREFSVAKELCSAEEDGILSGNDHPTLFIIFR
ncbi:hypothetical protein PanWU01x14_280850 [Parasponia andersonii]|uniref:Uncharacterized protein n=1 Tax=Parasponia andersonii TaxID=3476 RepID=A0A2P5B1E0_PARAD|nr:hypothetical protein PanWU01x14_280850 [Parasponia andersonii]